MSEGLDDLLAEVFSKSILKEDKEDGEIDSDCEEKKKTKKCKHKSKSKSCKSSRSSDKNKCNTNNENESQVMKLLLSSKLKSYAEIAFKGTEDNESKSDSTHKKSKHKNSKKDEKHKKNKHSKKSSKDKNNYNEDEKYYCEDEYSYERYYSSKSNTAHEDYYYGSYYEGMSFKPSNSSSRKRSSRPLSPLYDSSWKNSKKDRSRSRSPIDEKLSHKRSHSPNERRSESPFYKSRYLSDNHKNSDRRSLSPKSISKGKSLDRNSNDESSEKIDRQKLLEIARENLLKMIEKGDLPEGTDVNKLKLKHLRELTTQKSVRQWTEFCRAISALESVVDFDSDLDSDYDSDEETPSVKGESDPSHPFSIRHPFKLKERKDIEIKVRDFVQLRNRTASEMALELRQTFPVSSGNQHRRKELEWQEVQQMPPPPPPPPKKAKKAEPKPTSSAVPETITCESSTNSANSNSVSDISSDSSTLTTTESQSNSESVFPKSSMPIDIGSIMAQRLSAMRKLQTDPHNVVALKQMYQSNQLDLFDYCLDFELKMTEWAESKIVPGQFTGSTGANVMTGDQLNGPINAWTRKDQLKTAAPITEGIGMFLLMKMGWSPGQGLGKNNEGVIDPIMLEIKFDKKGLVAEKEEVRNLPLQLVSVAQENAKNNAKNPVSILHELCAKKKWGSPLYDQVFEQGPDHRKNFMFKVIVNGVEYQPSVSSSNKKQARALAAGVCLQAFGLLPKDQN